MPPPIDIRFLRYLSPQFLMQHPELVSLHLSDTDHNHQVDQNEAEAAVIRDSLFSQMNSPPIFPPRVAEQINR
jgi:DNA-binding transcriptional LysR family regulator